MKNILRTVLIILALIVTSCSEKIDDLHLDNTYKHLIVYGELTNRPGKHWVKLTGSADYFSNAPAPSITGAHVFLSDGADTLEMTESATREGVYETYPGYRGTVGKTYYLFINNVDIDEDGTTETYQAESYLPPVNPVDSITFKYTDNSFISGWEVQIWAKDPEELKNYYSFKVWKNNVLLTDTLSEYIVQDDELFNGSFTYGITAQFLNDKDGSEKAVPGDLITFEIDGITGEYFDFVQQAQAESFGSNPLFSGPPANITGNISNGALGFFTAYSVSKSSRVIPDYPSDK